MHVEWGKKNTYQRWRIVLFRRYRFDPRYLSISRGDDNIGFAWSYSIRIAKEESHEKSDYQKEARKIPRTQG